MNKWTKVWLPAALAVLATAVIAGAGSIKTWTGGDTLTISDLNDNFDHLHDNMVGGHGARLVDSDISTSAAITHSKMATPMAIPKAMSVVPPGCTSGTCSQNISWNVSAVAWNTTGLYDVTLSPARDDAVYGVMITGWLNTGANCSVGSASLTTTGFSVQCTNTAGTAADSGFTFVIYDNT